MARDVGIQSRSGYHNQAALNLVEEKLAVN
jgi:hypothetical protein